MTHTTLSYPKEEKKMTTGKPVKLRLHGFNNDIGALNRLRTSLKLDSKLDKNDVARAIVHLDHLIDALVVLHESRIGKLSVVVTKRRIASR
jgi:hypothetical protein